MRHFACWCAGFVSSFLIALVHAICCALPGARHAGAKICIAQVKYAKVPIWVPTQVTFVGAAITVRVVEVAEGDVSLTVTLLGSGFARRLERGYIAWAVRSAMDCGGRPVQLIWSREADTNHDFYRPMHVASALRPRYRGT